MLFYALTAIGLCGAVFTVFATEISYFYILLLFPAYALGLYILQVLCFVLTCLCANKEKPVEHIKPSFWRFELYHTCYMLLKLMRVRIHISGQELLPPKGESFLCACNHLSHFDPMVLSVLLYRRNAIYITKPGNIDLPLAGPLIAKAGFISIDRDNPRSAMTAIQTAAHRMTEDDCAVVVYPEGTISRIDQLLGFHDGVFLSAKKAKVPVVVATLDGTDKIKKNWYKWGTHVYVRIVGIIPAEEVRQLRTADISLKARELMRPSLIEAGYNAPPAQDAVVMDLSHIPTR
ncbi:MAG: 1-acyl-sn-glycerol-3-phosphate acyltransferase [Clostridia bacterium]|nr:1-acyl-sn-glycerol-3-phosphate acyltransferase [Clostridia bacterium]